jgi:hypothetical protein
MARRSTAGSVARRGRKRVLDRGGATTRRGETGHDEHKQAALRDATNRRLPFGRRLNAHASILGQARRPFLARVARAEPGPGRRPLRSLAAQGQVALVIGGVVGLAGAGGGEGVIAAGQVEVVPLPVPRSTAGAERTSPREMAGAPPEAVDTEIDANNKISAVSLIKPMTFGRSHLSAPRVRQLHNVLQDHGNYRACQANGTMVCQLPRGRGVYDLRPASGQLQRLPVRLSRRGRFRGMEAEPIAFDTYIRTRRELSGDTC